MIAKQVRPWILLGAGVLLLVLIGKSALSIYSDARLHRAVVRYEKDAGALTGKAYARPPVSETNNIATWLNAGASAFVVTNQERNILLSKLLSTPYDLWDLDSKSKLREILLRNEPALKLLDRMSGLDQSSFGLTYGIGLNIELPNFYQFLQARKLLACKWRADLAENRMEELGKTGAILERMAAALEHEPVLISTLVGHVSEKEFHELVHHSLPKATPAMLSSFSAQLTHLRTMAVPISTVLAAEGAMTYGSLAQADLSGLYKNSEEIRSTLHRWMRLERRLVMVTSMEIYADLVHNSKAPITTFSGQSLGSAFDVGPEKLWREMLAEISNSAIERHQAAESARILAQLAVKICEQRAIDGNYPKNLAQFRAELSPYTGEVMQYEVSEDGSATLSFPKANRFWESRNKNEPPVKPRFVWNLPHPEKGKTRADRERPW